MSDADCKKLPDESFPTSSRNVSLFVISAFVCNFATTGIALCFCVFQDWYQHSLFPSEGLATIALVGGLQFSVFYCVAGVTFPTSWDKTCLMSGGAACCVAAWLWCSFARHLAEILIAQGVLFAGGAAVLHATMANVVAERPNFKSHKLAVLIPSGAVFGAVFWSILMKMLIPLMSASSVYHILAIISAVLLTCPVGAICYLCRDSRIIVQPSGPPSSMPLSMQVIHTASVFFIHLGIPMPLIYIAFWGTDSDLGGICSFLPALFFASAIIGHFSSLFFGRYVSSPHLLFVETGIAGLFMLAFPMMVTSVFMAVAAACFGLFLGHVIVTVFGSHQLHSRHSVLDTAVACLSQFINGPLCALIIEASEGGRFGMCFFAGGCLVLGCCLVRIYDALDETERARTP